MVELLQFGRQLTEPGEVGPLLDGLASVGDERLGTSLLVDGDGVAALGEEPLDAVRDALEFVAGVGLLTQSSVLAAVCLGVRRSSVPPRPRRGWSSR